MMPERPADPGYPGRSHPPTIPLFTPHLESQSANEQKPNSHPLSKPPVYIVSGSANRKHIGRIFINKYKKCEPFRRGGGKKKNK